MVNTFFTASGNPATGSDGLSALIRGEFLSIQTAFDLVPQIKTTGAFTTVFAQQGNYTFTLPAAAGALAMLSDVTAEVATRAAADTAEAGIRAAAIALLAPLASPVFTGTPTVPTPGNTDHTLTAVNSTWVANFLAASGYAPTGASPVTSVAARTGAVTLAHTDLTDWAATLAPYALAASYAAITSIPPLLRGFLGGLGLSVDAVSPLLVLDIAAGTCTDSTNATTITLGAFTKSIGGSWTAGSGNNGMGVGLTATANTWYHVYTAIIGGTADVFFDTSVTAVNKPAGTTAFRRIGAFLLDPLTHIREFDQYGDRFWWRVPYLEYSGTPGVTAAIALTLARMPTGMAMMAQLTGTILDASASESVLFLSSLTQVDSPPSTSLAATAINGVAGAVHNTYVAQVMTNTIAQIRRRVSTATTAVNIVTNGWVDTRGRG